MDCNVINYTLNNNKCIFLSQIIKIKYEPYKICLQIYLYSLTEMFDINI